MTNSTTRQYCGGCHNHVDLKTAVRWVRPGGAVVWFCSEECKVVGENIEPPAAWAPTPPAVLRDEKKVRKATMKRKPAARPAKKSAKKTAKKATSKKAVAKKTAKRAAAKKPAKRGR